MAGTSSFGLHSKSQGASFAQGRPLGNPNENHPRYKLVDLGTFGGPLSTLVFVQPTGLGGFEIGVGIAIARDPLLGPGRALISASGSYRG
jgi:hypothetical protein